ncbi:MAG: hypothetical protein KKB24_01605 [Candidatus Altiarchaeota archaeon]|nr:hypothetical protein [Candidatus Altiarchaeota archaeon]MBU4406262.1 hypothetical protein [Candidatus Altiarchaeota archaeon]MBU4436747.1 hypothetical protein [Candidatus Altiarchaeota archaeon]
MTGEEIDTHNITVDEEENSVAIRVNPRLYKTHFIMNAAHDLTETAGYQHTDIVIDGDPDTTIVVKFIPREKKTRKELLNIAYQFNSLLIALTTTR